MAYAITVIDASGPDRGREREIEAVTYLPQAYDAVKTASYEYGEARIRHITWSKPVDQLKEIALYRRGRRKG